MQEFPASKVAWADSYCVSTGNHSVSSGRRRDIAGELYLAAQFFPTDTMTLAAFDIEGSWIESVSTMPSGWSFLGIESESPIWAV